LNSQIIWELLVLLPPSARALLPAASSHPEPADSMRSQGILVPQNSPSEAADLRRQELLEARHQHSHFQRLTENRLRPECKIVDNVTRWNAEHKEDAGCTTLCISCKVAEWSCLGITLRTHLDTTGRRRRTLRTLQSCPCVETTLQVATQRVRLDCAFRSPKRPTPLSAPATGELLWLGLRAMQPLHPG
jgi:hypothetical protein